MATRLKPDDIVVSDNERKVSGCRGFTVTTRDGEAIVLTEPHNRLHVFKVIATASQPADLLVKRVRESGNVVYAKINPLAPSTLEVTLRHGEEVDWERVTTQMTEIIFDHLFPPRKWWSPLTWLS